MKITTFMATDLVLGFVTGMIFGQDVATLVMTSFFVGVIAFTAIHVYIERKLEE